MREFKRQRGYLTFAQQGKGGNYLRMAYALALSLSASQTQVPHLSVVVSPDTDVPDEYRRVFDEVIDIPWGDDSEGEAWKIHNKWKAYYVTPYRETVLLDSDMLFTVDVSHWWETLSEKNIWLTTKPVTYRAEPITPGYYRREFIENSLPMVYTAFAYFRQHEETTEFFKMLQAVFHTWKKMHREFRFRNTAESAIVSMKKAQNPDRFSWTHFLKDFPPRVSGDLAYALTTKILGKESDYAPDTEFPTFVHMKSRDQKLASAYTEDWTKLLPWSLKDDLTLLVGNHVQRHPFHYYVKSWLTDEIIEKLEKANG